MGYVNPWLEEKLKQRSNPAPPRTITMVVELESLDTIETAAGDVAIHVELFYYDQKYRAHAGLNVMAFSKSGTTYYVMLLAFGSGTEAGTMNYLKDNITFE